MTDVAQARARVSSAIVAMVSYSIVVKMGEARFVKDAAAAGFNGLIVPDLPLEESGSLRTLAAQAGLSLSLLVSPTTPPARAADIARACTGFVYLLARTGITGAATESPRTGAVAGQGADLAARVAALRHATSLPIACGFGISTRDDVRAVLKHADAAIVGSAIVKAMTAASREGRDPVDAATAFVRGLL